MLLPQLFQYTLSFCHYVLLIFLAYFHYNDKIICLIFNHSRIIISFLDLVFSLLCLYIIGEGYFIYESF